MDQKTSKLIEKYVNENIETFHTKRIEGIANLKLADLLKSKNPYLFKAKNINVAAALITAILDARLSSSEEGSFGGFLEHLAIFVAENTGGGYKSAAKGIDIEIFRKGVRYLIAVKSGKNWGNAGQHSELRNNFKTAIKVIRQAKRVGELQPTLGICYGKFKTVDTGEYLHIGGQSFWNLISDDPNLYIDLIEPIGYKAQEHNATFNKEKSRTYNRLIREFMDEYCRKDEIDWPKLVRFVSGNLGEAARVAPPKR